MRKKNDEGKLALVKELVSIKNSLEDTKAEDLTLDGISSILDKVNATVDKVRKLKDDKKQEAEEEEEEKTVNHVISKEKEGIQLSKLESRDNKIKRGELGVDFIYDLNHYTFNIDFTFSTVGNLLISISFDNYKRIIPANLPYELTFKEQFNSYENLKFDLCSSINIAILKYCDFYGDYGIDNMPEDMKYVINSIVKFIRIESDLNKIISSKDKTFITRLDDEVVFNSKIPADFIEQVDIVNLNFSLYL